VRKLFFSKKEQKGILIALLDLLIMTLGWLTVWYELWKNNPVAVDWFFLSYRSTYLSGGELLRGVWTWDWFQFSILLSITLTITLTIYLFRKRK
jgi:hypothetical protein